MNTRKLRKAILTLCSALLLVSLSVGMTLAYLTDTTEVVKNTFTVGNVKITLDEVKVDEYGVPATDANRVRANTYKLMPGHEYTKDPTVHVQEGSEPAYVRMFVQITDIEDLLKACDKTEDNFLPQDFVEGWDPDVWLSKSYEIKDNVAVCEFWYKDIVDARTEVKDLPALFTKILVPGAATNEEIADLSDMKINIIAQAIQSDSFVAEGDKTAMEKAWEATTAPSFEDTTTDNGTTQG